MNPKQSYERKAKRVSNQLKQSQNQTVALDKTTSNLFRNRESSPRQKLNVRDFTNVININDDEKTVEVEGMTTFEALVDATLEHNFVPTVAPELKSITIGGAISGIGIESSSFKYGFVHETVLEMDVLTGTGEIITCSPEHHSDLFYAIPNSYGTLGYVLRAKLMLTPSKPYVEITRKKYTDYEKYIEANKQTAIEARAKGTYDYVDGLIFHKDEMYLMPARFVDETPFLSDYTYLDIYYKSMHKERDYLPTKDYIFRYDTDWFWAARSIGLENRLLRRLFGRKRLRSDVYYKILKWEKKHKIFTTIQAMLGHRFETFIQDAEVPAHQAAEFIEWFHRNITDHRPLTIGAVIPYSPTAKFTLFPMNPKETYMNIGYYASVPTEKEDGYYNRLFEKKLIQLGAKKMMYSASHYTKEEFWQIFNKEAYDKLKKKI